MPHDAKQIIKRYEQLRDDRLTWETTWQEISDHILGRRDFTRTNTPGEIRTTKIYDNTGMLSWGLLTGGILTLLANPATRWFKLKMAEDRLGEVQEVAEWLDRAERAMYSAINRPEARFLPQLHETVADIVAFGTSGLFIDDDIGNGVRFSSRALSELFVAENQFGVIDTVFQKQEFTARQAVLEWGENRVPKAGKLLEGGKPEEKGTFLRFIRPNNDIVPGRHDFTNMPWASTWLSLEERSIVFEGGFHEWPLPIPRWSIDAGETYGRGPGIQALPDAKMLNEMKKTTLKAAQKMTDPPLLVDDDGVLTQIRTSPASINVVRSTGLNRDPIRALQTSNPEVGVEMLERERVSVRAAFHFELLQLLQDPRMTATQVIELSNRMQQLLSPIMGRLQVELLEPLINRVFGILRRQGRLDPIPEVLAEQDIRVEYVSPVARAQKEGDANAIIELFTIAANLSQVVPEVPDTLDSDEAMRLIAKLKDAPESVVRPTEEVEQIRQARAQLAQQQAEEQSALAAADAASKLIPAVQGVQQGEAA